MPTPIPAPVKQDNTVPVLVSTIYMKLVKLVISSAFGKNPPIVEMIVPIINVANKPKAIPFKVVMKKSLTALGFFSLYPVNETAQTAGYAADFCLNGYYWKVIAYASAVGGNILAIGSMGGIALMNMEHIHVGWFFRNVGVKALIGGTIGLIVMIITALA